MKDERLHNALIDSLKLSGNNFEEALLLIDKVIAEAIQEGDGLTAIVLIEHAAILNGGEPDLSLMKHYYDKFLIHSPEDPRVLYESADVAMKDGQIEIAKEYAKRCHETILRCDKAKIKSDLLDLVLERWPEVL